MEKYKAMFKVIEEETLTVTSEFKVKKAVKDYTDEYLLKYEATIAELKAENDRLMKYYDAKMFTTIQADSLPKLLSDLEIKKLASEHSNSTSERIDFFIDFKACTHQTEEELYLTWLFYAYNPNP